MTARDHFLDRCDIGSSLAATPGVAGPPIAPGLVSVVVPCYNYGRFLESSVRSATSGQLGREVEVVIIDDCSTDDTEAVGRRLAREVPHVRYVRNPVNLGHIATYNVGLAAARGEFVTLVSADDFVTPGALARAASVLEREPYVAFVYGDTLDVDSVSTDLDRQLWASEKAHFSVDIVPGLQWAEQVCVRVMNPITSPEVVVRASAQRAVGGYSSELPHAGDLEMWLRLTTVGSVARIAGPVQAVRRYHGRNMSNGYLGLDNLRQVRQALLRYRHYAAEVGAPPSVPQELSDEALAATALWMARSQLAAATSSDQEAAAEALLDFAFFIYPGARHGWRGRLLEGSLLRRPVPWAMVTLWEMASRTRGLLRDERVWLRHRGKGGRNRWAVGRSPQTQRLVS